MLKSLIAKIQLPDFIYKFAISYQLQTRLKEQENHYKKYSIKKYAQNLKTKSAAEMTAEANEQHYEVPVDFFHYVLGKHKKYSCAFFDEDHQDLNFAENAMLSLSAKRAQIKPGQNILDLGCGWGSMSLFLAQNFPDCAITAVSNSHSQKQYIEAQIKQLELHNLTVITQNASELELKQKFDRIICIEMLEHIKNYQTMFSKVANWLKSDGLFFVHIFGHQKYAYPFDNNLSRSWMARNFFSGGQMPSRDLFSYFQDNLKIINLWDINGLHYTKTAEIWLRNMDRNKKNIMPIFKQVYAKKSKKYWIYWRIFFLACQSLFAYQNGNQWQVYHYLLRKK